MEFNLEERLTAFAVNIIKYSNTINKSYAGQHLVKQIVRSATSPALNYAEAQSSESKKDFIHKIKVVLKELRETRINLRIIVEADLIPVDNIDSGAELADECNQLIAIFVSSVKTASKGLEDKKVYR